MEKERERCGTRRGPRSRELVRVLVRVLVKLVEHKAREVSDFRSECFDRFMRNLEFLNFWEGRNTLSQCATFVAN